MKSNLPIAAVIALSALSSAATDVNSGGRPHQPLRIVSTGADGSVVSPNWSGYAVTGEATAITGVTGSWIVATATCGGSDPAHSGASQWVGIDGYTSVTVEQTGTDVDCSRNAPRYYAWYEFYPDPGVTITSLLVQPGDLIRASVTYSDPLFTVTLTDETTHQSFTQSKAVAAAKRNSAEWITEANSQNFTDFGTAFFGRGETGLTGTCAATTSARTLPIGGFPGPLVHAITMADDSGTSMAVPSPLSSDGTTFSVQWQSAR